MKNNKNLLIIGGIVLAVIIAIIIGLKNRQTINWNEEILFYGNTCPHCKIVEQYISDHDIASKFKFKKLEVYHNQDNATLLRRYAKRCDLNIRRIGVPFFWTGQKCLIGEGKVINYFQRK